jgi:hypothetical protein
VVDVVQEHVQGTNSLCETSLDRRPFRRRNNPWQQGIRPNLLGALIRVIGREGDSLIQNARSAASWRRLSSSPAIPKSRW